MSTLEENSLAIPDPSKKLSGIRKFTKTNRTIVLGALRRGNYLGDAAALAGIQASTLREWIIKGKKDYDDDIDSEWSEFYTDVLKAEAASTDAALSRIQSAAEKGFWKADAWRLERKNPEKWGAQSKVVVGTSSTNKDAWIHISDPNEQINAIKAMNGDVGPKDEDFIFDAEFTQVPNANYGEQDRSSADPCRTMASGEIPLEYRDPLQEGLSEP